MKTIINTIGFTLAFLTSVHANAMAGAGASEQARATNEHLVTFEEVIPTEAEIYAEPSSAAAARQDLSSLTDIGSGVAGADIQDLITLGTKLFELIKENAPVVNISHEAISVVPKGITNWLQLSGWQAPVSKVFELNAKNSFGMTVVKLRLKVAGNYGGNYQGKGQFLANVDLIPTQVYALWGYRVDVSVSYKDALNMGSARNPVAGLPVLVSYRIRTLFSDDSGNKDYWFTGGGTLDSGDKVDIVR